MWSSSYRARRRIGHWACSIPIRRIGVERTAIVLQAKSSGTDGDLERFVCFASRLPAAIVWQTGISAFGSRVQLPGLRHASLPYLSADADYLVINLRISR